MNSRGFVDHVLELARGAGRPTARAMFGGHGVYLDGTIVAIIVDDALYLKADASSAAAFDERNLRPFVYVTKDGERIVMSYRLAPDEVLESPAAMRDWLRLALGAALRKPAKTSGPRRRA